MMTDIELYNYLRECVEEGIGIKKNDAQGNIAAEAVFQNLLKLDNSGNTVEYNFADINQHKNQYENRYDMYVTARTESWEKYYVVEVKIRQTKGNVEYPDMLIEEDKWEAQYNYPNYLPIYLNFEYTPDGGIIINLFNLRKFREDYDKLRGREDKYNKCSARPEQGKKIKKVKFLPKNNKTKYNTITIKWDASENTFRREK